LAARRVVFSRAEADIVFDAYAEQAGRDLRHEFGSAAYTDPDVISFGIAGIAGSVEDLLRATGSFTKRALGPAVRNVTLPGTTADKIATSGLKGTAVGALAGGVQAATDGDPDTHTLPGILRGAGTGAAIGGAAGLVRGSTPFVGGDLQPSMQDLADRLKKQAAQRGFTV
jgi:hypothetical protein